MFGFGKKATPPSDASLISAGIWAGVLFLQSNAKFGTTPDSMVAHEIADTLKLVLKGMQLSLSEDQLIAINAVASSIAFDDTGFARSLVERFDRGERTITDAEISKAIALTEVNATSFVKALARR